MNRLINEKSPYLLQHSSNPVDWFPWGNEAFEKAKTEDKPIFLSIGYSTCHWCHVMEEESFEDNEIAQILNDNFVAIKVDREERPDIDAFYMKVCQTLTGSGGWPLTIIMTPDKKPFFAGTYFPKESVYGRIGLKELLLNVIRVWTTRRQDIENSTENLLNYIKTSEKETKKEELDENLIHNAFKSLEFSFDKINGGFGSSPKFPVAHNLLFLLDYAYFFKNPVALEMVKTTLTKMRLGGIYDQIGFGFHRYSTDAKWIVPHFEKMLYDQGMLLWTFSKAYQHTKEPLFLQTADEITQFVFDEFLWDGTAFYSSLDADSDGMEGKYYLFTFAELESILKEDFLMFKEIFNVSPNGNFYDPHFPERKENILYLSKDLKEIAKEKQIDFIHLSNKFSQWRNELAKYRNTRTKPFKDYKILTDWNGLMFAGLSAYFSVTKNPKILDFFSNYHSFLINKLINEDGKLFHCFIDGDCTIEGFIDDYAYTILALLEMYKATSQVKCLQTGLELLEKAIEFFWDEEVSAFRLAPQNTTDIVYNPIEFFDGATPSGNSVMYYNLNSFYKLTSKKHFQEISSKLENTFSGLVSENPSAYNYFNFAFQQKMMQNDEIVICYSDEHQITEYKHLLSDYNLPNALIIWYNINDKSNHSEFFWKDYKMIDNQPTGYICSNFQCKQPITNFEVFKNEIEKFGNIK